MTRLEAAAADYANAHRAWAVNTGQTFNIEAATAYATKDAGVKPVSREQFYSAVGRLNVDPQIQPGPYPYTSLWKTSPDRRVVGKSVGRIECGLTAKDYFLAD